MIRKLIAHGKDAALIIDEPLLDRLQIDLDTPLEITSDGDSLIISPVRDTTHRERVTDTLQRVNSTQQNVAKIGRVVRRQGRLLSLALDGNLSIVSRELPVEIS